MKNLANCKPSEFLKQTNRIKKSAEKWLKDTDLMAIRQNKPELLKVDADADADTKAKVYAENQKRIKAQAMQNLSVFLDAALDTHADETLELLALMCFVEPKDVDKHSVEEYLNAITDLMNNQAVISFFTSLAQWGQTNTLPA